MASHLQGTDHSIIWINGLPGSGKSTIGGHLAQSIGAEYIDSDNGRRPGEASFRVMFHDSILVQHAMLSRAKEINCTSKRPVVMTSLLSLEHESVYRIGLFCDMATLINRKTWYYEKLFNGEWHTSEKTTLKSIDRFSGFQNHDLVIDASKPIESVMALIIKALKTPTL